ncbi:MAG: hypothetical protein ACE5FI_11000 [Anaerolineales bacterium]
MGKRANRAFIMGHLSEREYLTEQTRIAAVLGELRPAPSSDLLRSGELLAEMPAL